MAQRSIISFLTHEAPTSPDGGAATLAQALDVRVREGELIEKLSDHAVRCFACGHRCLVKPGRRGICKVRFNRDGTLYVPAGYVAALQCDPTEKKPFFHALPGSDTLTFGMLGCDFHCGYCQNWLTSQALRDDAAGVVPTDVTPDDLVRLALRQGAKLVGSSYNEPLITAEWALDVFKVARGHGLKTAFISNGNATPEVLDFIRPWTDCYKIDFKAMEDRRYRELGGVLQHVLDAIRMVYERGFWLELVTLVVPGFNDDDDQLRRAADYIASVSPEIPWHVTAFHKDYRMTDPDNTSAETLLRACEIGAAAGLKFVYAGNLPGRVGRWEHTWCPDCGDHHPPAPDAHVGIPRRHPGPGAQGHPRQRSAHGARAARDAPGPARHPCHLQRPECDPTRRGRPARGGRATRRLRCAGGLRPLGPSPNDVPAPFTPAPSHRAHRGVARASRRGYGPRRQRVQAAWGIGQRRVVFHRGRPRAIRSVRAAGRDESRRPPPAARRNGPPVHIQGGRLRTHDRSAGARMAGGTDRRERLERGHPVRGAELRPYRLDGDFVVDRPRSRSIRGAAYQPRVRAARPPPVYGLEAGARWRRRCGRAGVRCALTGLARRSFTTASVVSAGARSTCSGAGTGNSGSRWSRFRIRPAWRRSVSRFPPSQPRCISCFPLPTAGYWPARTRSRSCCDGCRGSAGWRGDSISPAYRSWHGGCTVGSRGDGAAWCAATRSTRFGNRMAERSR